jgi:hypothetical protein
VCTLFYAIARRFFRLFDASVHTERTRVATITRLKSGSWRVQVRRKGKCVNETFLRRKDAEEWGIDIERRIDRQEPTTFGNRFRLVVSSDLRWQRQCGKTKLQELNGATSTPADECSSFEIGKIPERRRATTSEFLSWMYQAMTHARSLRSKDGSRIFVKAGFFRTTDDPLEQHFVASAGN